MSTCHSVKKPPLRLQNRLEMEKDNLNYFVVMGQLLGQIEALVIVKSCF